MKITFDDIYNCGKVKSQTKLYTHIHYPEMPSRYDSNFVNYKVMPTTEQFVEVIEMLTKYHQQNGQNFVKCKFPPNEVPPKSLFDEVPGFDVGFLELYAIDPRQFTGNSTEVTVKIVEDQDLEAFLQLQYKEDLHYGESYAKEKQAHLKRERQKQGIHQVIAYKNGQPVGSVELIEKEKTVEIDNFFVISTMRGLGIGVAIQQFVMQLAGNKLVILVADGEDTARNMYKKQGYRFYGFQYEALKVDKDA